MERQDHDRYAKKVLREAAGAALGNDASCFLRIGNVCGGNLPRIDGTVGGVLAVEAESRTRKQVMGAIKDLELHTYPKKLLMIMCVHNGPSIIKQCAEILRGSVGSGNFEVLRLHGSGANDQSELDVELVRNAIGRLCDGTT
jgi:hypothetical protein